MTDPRPILVPVDFSPHSEAALVWAASTLRCLGAPLHVLHVVHDPESAPGYYARAAPSDHVRRLQEIAAELLHEFIERVRAEHPALESLAEARTATRILEVASRDDAQLIVMGSRGRTGLSHLLIGSKAERVVQLSPIPVAIVKAPAGD